MAVSMMERIPHRRLNDLKKSNASTKELPRQVRRKPLASTQSRRRCHDVRVGSKEEV